MTPLPHFTPQKVRGWVERFSLNGGLLSANPIKSANSVKRIFGLSGEIPYLGGTLELLKVKEACQFMNQITGQNY